MTPDLFKYLLTLIYMALLLYLSWIGMRRTNNIKSFSIGNKDMNPYIVGMTLAASIASTATFVINPGFIYVHGVSAFLHFGVSGSLGILVAFIVLTRGFLRLGEKHQSLTIPQWILHRYRSRYLSLFFAVINLLSITFVVLILVGCSLLITGIFGIDQKAALVAVLLFVFAYVLIGGTYAHAFTNTVQGMMMFAIALYLVGDGLSLFGGHFIESICSIGKNYAAIYNPDSSLYYDFFSVFASGFIITFALMLQPHILTKVLYLRNEKDINKFIATTVIVGMGFSLILMLGFYARFVGLEIDHQDEVVRDYLLFRFGDSSFGEYALAFIFLALLAAGMSTLDGILVSLSAIIVNDIVLPLSGDDKKALAMSRWVLVAVGCVGLSLAWDPPKLVGLFAQKGVYGLAAASAVPVLFGVLLDRTLSVPVIFTSALIGLFGHLYLNLFGGILNPAVSASYAILASLTFSLIALFYRNVTTPDLE